MKDFLTFWLGVMTAAIAYLIATSQRHEDALRYHQSFIDHDSGKLAGWDELNGKGIQD